MSTPLEVFCCYAREDKTMLISLKTHLAPLVRQGQITIWSDTDLNAGIEWERELHQHLESADIILLLISPDFMASDYCYSIEMGRAITRHNEDSALIIPILLRSTFWQNAPFAKFQIVPTNAKPVTSWPNHDDAFHDVTMQINWTVSELQKRRAQIRVNEYNEEQQRHMAWQPELVSDVVRASISDSAKLTLFPPLIGHTRPVSSVTFSLDGKILASGSDDNTIKLWELPSGREIRTLTNHTLPVSSVAISPDGKLLASGSYDHTIKLWELSSGQELRTLISHTEIVSSVAISPDGKLLASGSYDHTIKLWELSSGQELRTLISHTLPVSSVAISSDGKLLASGSDDHTIKLWELSSGREIRTLIGHTNYVLGVAISPNSMILASGSKEQIKLWEVPSGQELCTLTGLTGPVSSVTFSPDGKILAGDVWDDEITLWEIPSGRKLRTLISPMTSNINTIESIAFSPDGQTLAIGSNAKIIKLWGSKSGRTD